MPLYQFIELRTGSYMTPNVKTVTPDTTLGQLEGLFEEFDFNAFPVMENGSMTGLVTKFDFLKGFAFTEAQMLPHYHELMSRPVSEVMSQAVTVAHPDTRLTRVLHLMVANRMRSLPVIGDKGELAGMISREDVMRALKEATRN